MEAIQGALIRLERWCLPLNLRKCETSFFSVDPHQANLLLFTPFLPFHCHTNFSLGHLQPHFFLEHVSSLKAKFFLRLKALRCISTFSWGSSKEYHSLLCKAFLRLALHPDGFLFLALPALPCWNASTERPVAPSPAASRSSLSHFSSLRHLYLPYKSPRLISPCLLMSGPFISYRFYFRFVHN